MFVAIPLPEAKELRALRLSQASAKVLRQRPGETVTYTVMAVFAYTVEKNHIGSVRNLAEKSWGRTLGCYDCDAGKNEVLGHDDGLEVCARS